MSKILLSGGSGFLGSHVTDRLLKDGHEVTVLDNLLTGRRVNLEHLADHPKFQFFERDVAEDLSDLYEGGWDAVMHMASPASPVDYTRYPIETLRVGSHGTENLLEVARHSGARFFLSSTSEVYGDPEVHPQVESYVGHVSSTGTRACYDEAKRFAEAITFTYHRQFGIPIRVVRTFNTYGPRNRTDDGRVVPNFIMQALRNEPITIHGDGHQTRSFCYVADQVEGIVRLLWSDYNEPVNIGNPVEMTIREFAELIIELTGSESQLTFQPLPHKDDPKRRCPNIDRAKEVLGWSPQVSPREGFAETIAYYRQYAK
ncbi:MAG: SDR family oxidoreductase [Myxococcales bacterium]|nr:SDR family oxidoreductase [Myxococcales bacterium]MCB9643247.1 SDR family oxidoreductase [Myxococcales bacterium]